VAVVTNVDHDHVDVFPTKGEYDEAFRRFAAQVTGTLVACADDVGAASLVSARVLRYGAAAEADYRIGERSDTGVGQTFLLTGPSGRGRVPLKLPRAHNALDAAAAVVAAG